MFLDVLKRRNRPFLDAVTALHQSGELPGNAYALDLDAVRANAEATRREADRHGLEVFAMTKQVGRAGGFLAALMEGGVDTAVAVDMACAGAVSDAGMTLGHLGHLVQVPQAETAAAAGMQPRYWTVFSDDKALMAAEASHAAGRVQNLLARIHAPGDRFYSGHEGGFRAQDIVEVASRLDSLDGARFAGITTFPALLFDAERGEVALTPNMATLQRAAERLREAGVSDIAINAPGTTSSSVFGLLADSGATQVEPGHGLSGTTPLHRVKDLPELPAACYVTEVSHLHDGRAYAFGGGLYIDPVFPEYRLQAIVAEEPGVDDARTLDATIPPPSAIDYYGQLDYGDGSPPRTGATVIFGFRIQAFVTRAYVAGISGVASGAPKVAGLWRGDGSEASWPR